MFSLFCKAYVANTWNFAGNNETKKETVVLTVENAQMNKDADKNRDI